MQWSWKKNKIEGENIPIKTSEEMFNEAMEKGKVVAKRNAERSKRIRELREQLNQIVTKSTFAGSQYDKESFAAQAQGLKRQIEALEATVD